MNGDDGEQPGNDEAVREALERALAQRAAIVEAGHLPGLGTPVEEPAPGRRPAPVPNQTRQHQD